MSNSSSARRLFHLREIRQPTDIIECLAEGEQHWRKGYSAYELAISWVAADGIPSSVSEVLDTCDLFRDAQLVEGFFERKVELRSRGHPSQTDLMAFIKSACGYSVIAVEGKVEEPFDRLVEEWHDHSPGKQHRLDVLCESLGLRSDDVGSLR